MSTLQMTVALVSHFLDEKCPPQFYCPDILKRYLGIARRNIATSGTICEGRMNEPPSNTDGSIVSWKEPQVTVYDGAIVPYYVFVTVAPHMTIV